MNFAHLSGPSLMLANCDYSQSWSNDIFYMHRLEAALEEEEEDDDDDEDDED